MLYTGSIDSFCMTDRSSFCAAITFFKIKINYNILTFLPYQYQSKKLHQEYLFFSEINLLLDHPLLF